MEPVPPSVGALDYQRNPQRPFNSEYILIVFQCLLFDNACFSISSSYSKARNPILTSCKEHEMLNFQKKTAVLDYSQTAFCMKYLFSLSIAMKFISLHTKKDVGMFMKEHYRYLYKGKVMQCICREVCDYTNLLITLVNNLQMLYF